MKETVASQRIMYSLLSEYMMMLSDLRWRGSRRVEAFTRTHSLNLFCHRIKIIIHCNEKEARAKMKYGNNRYEEASDDLVWLQAEKTEKKKKRLTFTLSLTRTQLNNNLEALRLQAKNIHTVFFWACCSIPHVNGWWCCCRALPLSCLQMPCHWEINYIFFFIHWLLVVRVIINKWASFMIWIEKRMRVCMRKKACVYRDKNNHQCSRNILED